MLPVTGLQSLSFTRNFLRTKINTFPSFGFWLELFESPATWIVCGKNIKLYICFLRNLLGAWKLPCSQLVINVRYWQFQVRNTVWILKNVYITVNVQRGKVHILSNVMPSKASLIIVMSGGCNSSTISLRIHISREYVFLPLLLINILHSNLKYVIPEVMLS
jgi:hypothetical protein